MGEIPKPKTGQCVDVSNKDGSTVRVCPTKIDGELKVGDKIATGCQVFDTSKGRKLNICNKGGNLDINEV